MIDNKVNIFSSEVIEKLAYYVYRLIDPRNGETFYVGKGVGNRVFSHINVEKNIDGDDISNKLKRIRSIKNSGFEVGHVIHRHGMDEGTAIEVEAALIDAYPGLTNIMDGVGNTEFGAMHALEIISQYGAETVSFNHKALIIIVNKSVEERDGLYDAVRYAWRIGKKKAQEAEIVLAVVKGIIKGVYVPLQWLEAKPENFPGLGEVAVEGRLGFIGREASADVKNIYMNKRIPDEYRRRGAANPIRYTW